MDTKICTRCRKEKHITEFHRKKKGHRSHCKQCVSEKYKNQILGIKREIPVKEIPSSRECIVCHTEKPSSEFHKRPLAADGLRHTCKSCQLKVSRNHEIYRQKHPRSNEPQVCRQCNVLKPADDFYSQPHYPTGLSPVCKECRHLNYIEKSRMQFKSALKNRYGITLDEYDRLLSKQNGLCAICGKPETSIRNGKVARLAVDHNHLTGVPRALLCSHCNSALGNLNDDPCLCEKAAAYLRKYSKETH